MGRPGRSLRGLGDEGDQHPLSGSYRATLICAWAEAGADALGPDGQLLHSDAFPPPRVVDTLGAGDTFNASVIFSLSKGESLSTGSGQGWVCLSRNARLTLSLVPSPGNSVQEALRFGCQVAGRKCGLQGFEGIV